MHVVVDSETLATEELGIQTVGQVLAHLRKGNRLVTSVLVDGQTPDLKELASLRARHLNGMTLFVETTEPNTMAHEVLDELERHIEEAEKIKSLAVEMLQRGQQGRALEGLARCFAAWQTTGEAITKVCRLLDLDTTRLPIRGVSLEDALADFARQLRQIRSALESRDFVRLADTLAYETSELSPTWRSAIGEIRRRVA
ncbi:MAG: hypothetical protein ACFCVE_01435 [Phycisphaerae bacterium]